MLGGPCAPRGGYRRGGRCWSGLLKISSAIPHMETLYLLTCTAEMKKAYELTNNVCLNFFLAVQNLVLFVKRVINVAILRCLGDTYGCKFVLYLTFILKRSKNKFPDIILASIHVYQSYFAHSYLILYIIYILRCFVANSLLLQFTHFSGKLFFGSNLVFVFLHAWCANSSINTKIICVTCHLPW